MAELHTLILNLVRQWKKERAEAAAFRATFAGDDEDRMTEYRKNLNILDDLTEREFCELEKDLAAGGDVAVALTRFLQQITKPHTYESNFDAHYWLNVRCSKNPRHSESPNSSTRPFRVFERQLFVE